MGTILPDLCEGKGGMQERLFYVRRHLRADGSSQWYVLNGHIRRACEQTKAEAEARRAKLQAVHDAAKRVSRDDT
jgi:hypothetical protein